MTDAEVQAKVDAAREAVWVAAREHSKNWVPDEAEIYKTRSAYEDALDHYARVCGLQEARRQLLRAECRYFNERWFKVTCLYPHPENHDERVCQRCDQLADDERELEGV